MFLSDFLKFPQSLSGKKEIENHLYGGRVLKDTMKKIEPLKELKKFKKLKEAT